MIGRTPRQPRLLDRYWSALRFGRGQPSPPAGLDPDLARMAEVLARESANLEPGDAFLNDLRRRLASQATSGTGRGWTTPALDPRPRSLPASDDAEEHDMSRLSSAPLDEPIDLRQRMVREWMKIAAAAIVFFIVGAILALTLRGGDDQTPAVQPSGPTPTIDVTPTSSVATSTTTARATETTAPTLVPEISGPPLESLPMTGTMATTVDIDQTIWRNIAVGAGSVWITNSTIGTVDRVDAATGEVVAQIRAGLPDSSQVTQRPNVWGIAYGHDAVWVTASREQAILRIDPATNEVTDTIYVDGHVASIAVTDEAVWAGSYDEPVILRVDPTNHETVTSIPVASTVLDIQVVGDSLWVLTLDGSLSRIDSATNEVRSSVQGSSIICKCRIALAGDVSGLWRVEYAGVIDRLDSVTGSKIAILRPNSGYPVKVAISGSEVWVAIADDNGTGHLERIDPTTNTFVERGPTFDLAPEDKSGFYLDVAVDGDMLWIVNSLDTVVGIDLGR